LGPVAAIRKEYLVDLTATDSALQQRIRDRAEFLRHEHQVALWTQTDRLFAGLLILQWLACIVLALWLSPLAWRGLDHYVHPHVWVAVIIGGWVTTIPVWMAIRHPAQTATRMTIAVAQMLHSALLIHLSGGRIETHFHVFGSLAFLSFYRDWRVLIPATVVVAVDHAWRGIFFPESVFGLVTTSSFRWMEHAGWVIFEDIILVWSCVRGARELATLAMRQAELEMSNERVHAEVQRQTARLESVTQELVSTARKAGMADIATGVLHNVGNVLNSVNVSASLAVQQLKKSEIPSLALASEMLRKNRQDLPAFLTHDERGKQLPCFLIELAECLSLEQKTLLSELSSITSGLEHIKHIVGTQQQHAKNDTLRERISPKQLLEEAIVMVFGANAGSQVELVRDFDPGVSAVALDKHKVLQILINLLSNAKRAVNGSTQAQKRIFIAIRIAKKPEGDRLQFEVTDNGVGIAAQNLANVFSYGFTTRKDGHGFGLHSAANAAQQMGGCLSVQSPGLSRGATFILELPLGAPTTAEQLLKTAEVSV
jgi:signal transduction histidine kinase